MEQNLEYIQNCPICAGLDFLPFLSCVDYTVSRETFKIVECKKCDFRFTNPRPVEPAIGKYYESTDYVSHSNSNKGVINKVYQAVRKYTLSEKLKLVNRLTRTTERSILDIGCGTGEFLNVCKLNGWETLGIEPSQAARKLAIGNYGLTIKDQDYLEGNLPTFNVITMWHVLEHVHDLNGRIERIEKLLSYEGHLIIAVPNCSSYDAEYYKEYWAGYDVPRHLYHFVPETMELLLDKQNLKIEEMLPMRFDSFYVSMLSEKYKSGANNFSNAFLTGFKSNQKAGAQASKYSSVIYKVKRKN